jgi:hypothetical protein
MRLASVPGSDGSGDHLDQDTGDPVWRLRVPGAGAVPWQDRAAGPVAPARGRHWPESGRPGVRREYDHQPGAPAASCVAPCAFAAVRDLIGRLLLVRRCDTGDWELPGGHVDPGESAADAAIRETAEESGMTIEVTGLVGIYPLPGGRSGTAMPGQQNLRPARQYRSMPPLNRSARPSQCCSQGIAARCAQVTSRRTAVSAAATVSPVAMAASTAIAAG